MTRSANGGAPASKPTSARLSAPHARTSRARSFGGAVDTHERPRSLGTPIIESSGAGPSLRAVQAHARHDTGDSNHEREEFEEQQVKGSPNLDLGGERGERLCFR